MGHTIRIELFGGMRIVNCGDNSPTLRSKKGASLLAYLALNNGSSVERELLASILWPDEDADTARSRLKTELSRLRRELDQLCPGASQAIVSGRSAIRLEPDLCSVDVSDFRNLTAEAASSTSPGGRIRALEAAIDLYAGPLWPGCYDEWIGPARAELANTHAHALLDLASALRVSGELQRAIHFASLAVTAEPLEEHAHCLLMDLYLAQGKPSKALRQFHELSTILNSELGVGPGPEARQLAQQCLAIPKVEPPPPHNDVQEGKRLCESLDHANLLTPLGVDSAQPQRNQPRADRIRSKLLHPAVAPALILGAMVIAQAATMMRPRPYHIVDMGGDIAPVCVSETGVVAAIGTSAPGDRAWMWDRERGVTVPPLPPGALWSEAQCVNSHGTISGWFGLRSESRAFVWDKKLGFRDLGPRTGVARSVNSSGVSAGFAGHATNSRSGPACEWDATGRLHALEVVRPGNADVNCINDRGAAVGYSTARGGVRRAAIWDANHHVAEIGTLPGESESIAYHINNYGMVVGRAGVRAFAWESARGIRELEPPSGEIAAALSNNDRGQTVGWYEEPVGRRRACIWDASGKATDLNNLVPSGSGWLLMEAASINARGEIAGKGLHNDHQSGFLLVPRGTKSTRHMQLPD